ncbi:C2 domain-containing protein 3 isoform X2 [Zootoca vivipara]|uniref:C2 domain-containing protein 3 isoform X2 n=1 Tax=Zootoca vivipara TaxID=8524 RepID=UPI00293BBC0D|nr:C2 domain-containing protein 3 isoform X2 [Zootoca vivipara]
MKQRKAKAVGPARPGSGRKKKDVSDISPSTSLPPLVEGQLRCFLKLTISKILWVVAKPPASFLIRVRWWGETSDGTAFVPRDTSQAEPKNLKTTTRYPVRCGPKQFVSYLTDMGALILEVMAKPDHLPIGRVQINGLAQLSPSHPISGFFTIVSPTSEKMGELQVSLALEPLSETYDSSSSIPNTDVSFSAGLSVQGTKETADSNPFLAPSQLHRPASTNIVGRESVSSSRATTPRGKDHLYFQENSENLKEGFFRPQHHRLQGRNDSVNANDPKQQGLFSGGSDLEAQVRLAKESPKPAHVLSCNNPPTKDLLSALLDKGNRLRNAMVVSAMTSNPDPDIQLYELQPIKQDVSKLVEKNLKNLHPGLISAVEEPLQPLPDGSEFDLDAENRAIQLLLGSSGSSPLRFLDGTGSPLECISPGSEVYDSELNDPHYDQSLLENLFYTARKSDSSLSDFLSDEEDAVASGKLNKSQNGKCRRSKKASESSPLGQKGRTRETKPSHSPAGPLPLHEASMESTEETRAVNLNLDRLAVLGRVRLARAVVESLKVPPENITPGKKRSTGKPPRPALAKKRTFFVEFHFPVGASKIGAGQAAITTEIVRIASSKISGEVVKFQQRYVFPVHFSGAMITHWWNSDLEFNIYSKQGTQRKPLLIGSAVFPLRDIIQSEQLTVSRELPVKEDGGPAQLGPLKVSLELAADNKDFSSTSAKAANGAPQAPVHAIRSPGVKFQEVGRSTTPAGSPPVLKQSNCQLPKRNQESSPAVSERANVGVSQLPVPMPVSRNLLNQLCASEEEGLLLHVLLMVPEGEVFVPKDAVFHGSCNVYLNCKLFSTEEATRSSVIWGTTQPIFQFSQVTPISLTSKHLERLKNNVMVIEAWNKVCIPGGDALLGLVKLPLHQFYVSFKDPKISSLLLQAQYPVLAVDGSMPVVDVFTGSKKGSLKVILAMGSAEQIAALQRLKNEEGMAPPVAMRPPHSLDSLAMPLPKQSGREKEGMLEHVFEIHIESVKGLTPLQSTVWGEADCYVQYHFPVQESDSDVLRGTEFCENGLVLKPFRSAVTLCVPDPNFGDERHHSLMVPADVPVQRLLLSSFSAQGIGGGAGIQFEIWCRYYYPNVRDQMVARGTLPLSRLCAMVTMQYREDVGIQTFSLPLIPRTESAGEPHPHSSGFLDVSVKYRRFLKATEGILAAQAVSISVQIHFAAGLQAAARAVAEKNPSLQCSAEVGVNAYVSVHLPFLPESERRNTRAVARTFCPEFEHHTEFPCNLVVQRSSGEACSLGELLQVSEIVFSIFHKSLNSAPYGTKTQASRDYLLGTAKIPTRDLLNRRSGIRGWFPITLPEDLVPAHCANILQTIVGGLELSVTFAHPGDRQRVLDAARLLGWNLKEASAECLQDDSESECQHTPDTATVAISIPRLWLPVQCVLLAGQTHLNKSIHCYLRYKLYDQEATWTSLRRPKLAEDQKHVTVSFKKSKEMDLPLSQALLWYFKEERLEVQAWRAYGNESNTERPLDTDRLIGSAYVDLAALGESSRGKRTVSGVFPLFRRNSSNLLGAAMRVHIVVAPKSPSRPDVSEDGSSGVSDHEERHKEPEQDLKPDQTSVVETLIEKPSEESPHPVGHEQTFAVSILVERAMHLSLKGSPLTERGVVSPSSYVSFVAADADNPIATEIVENSDSPVWDFQQQTRLSKELLLDPQQTLVFKVWHKADVERVIGFASVDLSPLLSGFQLVCGWYNITDFSGQCQGQIKVAVSPLENITHLKEERQARSQTKASGSSIPTTSSFALQAQDLYTAFPSFSTRGTNEHLKSPLKGTDATSLERTGFLGSWMPRHEEHVKNIRRFHESLQQAESNTCQLGRLDSLSHSSRTSLLGTLRKNLSELDEIQRYFGQKLTRPHPDLGSPRRNTDDLGASHQSPASMEADSEGRHLLEKSSHLVSQVSSLIADLQNNMGKNAEGSVGACVDGSQCSSAVASLGKGGLHKTEDAARAEVPKGHPRSEPSSTCVDKEPSLPLGESPYGVGMLFKFLGQANSQSSHPSPACFTQKGEGAAQSHSEEEEEEEYEEDVIEPRTLNEITTMTDRTSPWSSLVSEPEHDPAIMMGADQLAGTAEPSLKEGSVRSSPVSSLTQDDPQSMPSSARSSNSPLREDKDDEHVRRRDLEGSLEEPLPPAPISALSQTKDGAAEEEQREDGGRAQEIGGKIEEGEPFIPCDGGGGGDGDSAAAKHCVPETREGRLGLEGGPRGEEGRRLSEEACLGTVGAAQHSGSCSDESHENSPEESEKPLKPSVVLSDPVVVPNFFLPPQHLEASMRLLSITSPSPPAAAAVKAGSGAAAAAAAAAGRIPNRRPARHNPSLTPDELPEKEMRRIARIFSAQFSKKQ